MMLVCRLMESCAGLQRVPSTKLRGCGEGGRALAAETFFGRTVQTDDLTHVGGKRNGTCNTI